MNRDGFEFAAAEYGHRIAIHEKIDAVKASCMCGWNGIQWSSLRRAERLWRDHVLDVVAGEGRKAE